MIHSACTALGLVLVGSTYCFGATQTITTTYSYNADGAPTSVTVQTDDGQATTTYLTWYNFTPSTTAPSTGTVSAADGNLLGVGPSPGTSGLTTQFDYDARDRLTGCSPAGQSSVTYAYDPVSMMSSSTLASNDALQFYYDGGSAPRMVNTSQPSTKAVASFLGPVRYLSDGTEQVLLTPRKDTAGVYDAAAQSLSPYGYEPYGAPLASSTASSGLSNDGTTYDLTQNPFQYSAEYNDPSCSTYYLRSRWYRPSNQTFLSRDPADKLHRFSYTAGNPVGRTDPTGLMYTGGFSHDIDKAVHKLAPGIWAYLEPIMPVWGQVLSSIELLGDLPTFWHHPTLEGGITFGFLAASIASEAGGETKTFDRLFATPQRAFKARLGLDVLFGASQTAAQAYRHGRIDVPALIQGIDSTAFGIFYSRALIGFGYRPYNLTADDVTALAEAHFQTNDDLLVFRVRERVLNSGSWLIPYRNTSPILEDLHLGVYHEAVIAINGQAILRNELTIAPGAGRFAVIATGLRTELEQDPSYAQYAYVGKASVTEANVDTVMKGSPLGIPLEDQRGSVVSVDETGERLDRQAYTPWRRNCQMHAAAIRQQLGF